MSHAVSFNGVQLSSITGLTVLATNPYEFPRRDLNLNNIAQTDKSTLASAFYDERIITISVGIGRTTRDLAEASRDSLMAILQAEEGELQLTQAGVQRKYICTLGDVVVRMGGGAYLHLDLIFNCSDRFGYDIADTQLLLVSGSTLKIRSDSLSVDGTAPFQLPVITITFSAISGGTLTTVNVGNATLGLMVSITRTWTTNDVLQIDCYNGTVKVNGTEVEWTGALPILQRGINWLSYSDNFVTSRTYTTLVTYKKRWV